MSLSSCVRDFVCFVTVPIAASTANDASIATADAVITFYLFIFFFSLNPTFLAYGVVVGEGYLSGYL